MFHIPPSPTAMTQMSLHNHPLVPQPHSGNGKGPPPIPPRTYSNKSLMNGRPQHMVAPIKPMRKYCLEEFKFMKLLGKGSFGKVRKIFSKYVIQPWSKYLLFSILSVTFSPVLLSFLLHSIPYPFPLLTSTSALPSHSPLPSFPPSSFLSTLPPTPFSSFTHIPSLPSLLSLPFPPHPPFSPYLTGSSSSAAGYRELLCSESTEERCGIGGRWCGEHYGWEENPCSWRHLPLSHTTPLRFPDTCEFHSWTLLSNCITFHFRTSP